MSNPKDLLHVWATEYMCLSNRTALSNDSGVCTELVYVRDTLAIPAAHVEVSLPLLWITISFDVEVPHIE